MVRFALLIIILALAVFNTADGQVYKKRNADGSYTYTDKPVAGAQQVDIDTPPTTEFAKTQPLTDTTEPTNVNNPLADVTATVAITSPDQKETVRANNGEFKVRWQADVQGLQGRPIYELYLDTKPIYKGPLTEVTLREVSRGERRLQVRVYAPDDTELARTDITVVYVQRASVLAPRPPVTGGGNG